MDGLFQHIGISGTRNGMSDPQRAWFVDALTIQPVTTWLHHGCCVGVDENAHWLAFELGIGSVGHPPTDTSLQMAMYDDSFQFIDLKEPKPYHDRNRDIVNETIELWAFPASRTQKGGTWYTINYAKQVGKPVIIVYPDGEVGN